MNKIQRVAADLAKEHPEFVFFAESDPVAYYKALVPLLHERLTEYELEVLTEVCAIELSENSSVTYENAYTYYEMLYKFRVDPTFFGMMGLGGGKDDTAQGFSGIGS